MAGIGKKATDWLRHIPYLSLTITFNQLPRCIFPPASSLNLQLIPVPRLDLNLTKKWGKSSDFCRVPFTRSDSFLSHDLSGWLLRYVTSIMLFHSRFLIYPPAPESASGISFPRERLRNIRKRTFFFPHHKENEKLNSFPVHIICFSTHSGHLFGPCVLCQTWSLLHWWRESFCSVEAAMVVLFYCGRFAVLQSFWTTEHFLSFSYRPIWAFIGQYPPAPTNNRGSKLYIFFSFSKAYY